MDDLVIFAAAFAVAFVFQALNVIKMIETHRETGGVIRDANDLEKVKSAINHSMRSAVLYIAFSSLFGIYMAYLVFTGHVLSAVKIIFLFGITTMIMGLIGRVYEKRIRKMECITDDKHLVDKYASYLEQWDKPQFSLREYD